MNTLIDLQDKLRTTGSAIGRLEEELSRKPSRGVQANILSLKKLQSSLQEEFVSAADAVGMDVCRYRLLNDRPSAKAFAGAIGAFQDVISQIFEAIRTGPRTRRNLSAESISMSELQVAYTFPGSFGVAFTIPNSRLLFDLPSQLDKAATAAFDIITSDAIGGTEISDAVKAYGRAPIAAIYDWAKVNTDNGVGAGIEWVRGENVKSNIIVQAPQFSAITDSLEKTRQTDSRQLKVGGTLLGADLASHRFHFMPDNTDRSIRGIFTDAISESQQASIPSRYTAIINKTTETLLATEVQKESYILERLLGYNA